MLLKHVPCVSVLRHYTGFVVIVWRNIVVVYKGELYILSGYNGIHDLHFDDMYRFNPGKHCSVSLCIVVSYCCHCFKTGFYLSFNFFSNLQFFVVSALEAWYVKFFSA